MVDMRSDTVTQPTLEMRTAAFEAEVGDDVFGDDPTVKLLEKTAASIFGKEAALFVTSGTMGNLISVMVHCSRRGEEVLVGDRSHITCYEQGGVATLGGVRPRTVKTLPNGTLDLKDLKSKIMPDDVHFTHSRLVCIENTHNLMGGIPITPAYMDDLAKVARESHLKLHVDGARIFNAATALGVSVAVLVEKADSVSCCLSKGLAAPVGSIIAGTTKFITKARRLRKALGGGMRQAGVLAAPGLIALEKMTLRLQDDHDNARRLALGLVDMQHLGIKIDISSVRTNMVYFSLSHPKLNLDDLLETLGNKENGVCVKMLREGDLLRAVFHLQVSQEDINLCLQKMKSILES